MGGESFVGRAAGSVVQADLDLRLTLTFHLTGAASTGAPLHAVGLAQLDTLRLSDGT